MSCIARLSTDPVRVSQAVGLRYVTDDMPGIRRVPRAGGFVYLDSRGRLIRDRHLLERIRRLVIPPAWKNVWISPLETGHIQVTGRDARGRKQYRYHPTWQQARKETNFHRMLAFGRTLPRIRRRLRADLRKKGLPRERILAAVVTLLECTHIRVGNDEYAAENNSFGLTTFRDHHARVHGGHIHFKFRGKSGKEHTVELNDPRLARVVQACQDIPGQELFQYYDASGEPRDIGSSDVNDYLREITDGEFTAKDFRTWAGTVLFVEALRRMEPCRSRSQAKRRLVAVVREVAGRLRNTPAVCRNHYIHPFAMQSFLDNSLPELMERLCRMRPGRRNWPTEKLVIALLEYAVRQDKCAAAASGNGARQTARPRAGRASEDGNRTQKKARKAARREAVKNGNGNAVRPSVRAGRTPRMRVSST